MTTVAVAVVVAVVSGLGATFLTISHERGAELRGRMLEAADAFSIGVVMTNQRMRIIGGDIVVKSLQLIDPATQGFTAEFQRERREVNEKIDDLLGKLARIDLLFGDLSDTAVAGSAIVTYLRRMERALNDYPDSILNKANEAEYKNSLNEVIENHEAFNRAALRALRDTNPKRFGRGLQAALRRLFSWVRGLRRPE